MKSSFTSEKQKIIGQFSQYVSKGKADFFKTYNMDFVMGLRDGPTIQDIDGEKNLINLHCNGGVFNLGHRNPELINLLKSSLDELDIGNHHLMSQERAKLARKIAELMPGDLEITVFGVSGGEAVDLALKTARAATKRQEIISASGGYHGHTGLALSAGDSEYITPFGDRLPGFTQVQFGDISALTKQISNNTAAVILETVPATSGIIVPDKSYLKEVRRLCDLYDVILILDEVQTGLGRTGKLWAFEHFGIIPDIVVLGKGLSGGLYPITATVLSKKLASVFEENPFSHISTFGGSELGCLIATRVLDISSNPEFLKNVNKLSDLFETKLSKLRKKYPSFFINYRGLGLMMGLMLRDETAGPVLTKTAFDEDLLLVYANNDTSVCQFLPPLNLDESIIDDIMDKLDRAMNSARKLRVLLNAKKTFSRWRTRTS